MATTFCKNKFHCASNPTHLHSLHRTGEWRLLCCRPHQIQLSQENRIYTAGQTAVDSWTGEGQAVTNAGGISAGLQLSSCREKGPRIKVNFIFLFLLYFIFRKIKSNSVNSVDSMSSMFS